MNRSSYKKKKNEQKLMERKTISIFFSAKNNQRLGLACVYVFFLTAISKYTSINTKNVKFIRYNKKSHQVGGVTNMKAEYFNMEKIKTKKNTE